jgi:quercetin dioxygenase-like cupin family protein
LNTSRKGGSEWFEPTSQAKPFSDRFCPKTSSGSRSQRSHRRSDSPSVVGQPSEPGPYVIRVKVPSGVKLMPHRHPEDRVYTVMSGVFYIGLGEQFDGDKVKAYPPGSVIVLPGNTSHFHWAKSGEYVTQVTAIGPLGLEYLDPGDDPREQTSRLRQ